jgi:type IV pilus assembly protein PilA
MPTKVKGMTSIEIAILVGIVLIIAVAVGWYLYTTFAASIESHPELRVASAVAFTNGTIRVEVVNTGSVAVHIDRAEVLGTIYSTRSGVWIDGYGGRGTVYIDTGRWLPPGTVLHGKLITVNGYTAPFTVRVAW